jgi:hypothetical protein
LVVGRELVGDGSHGLRLCAGSVEQGVKLTDVPEGERAQKRPERRRGRDPAAEQPARAAGP